MNKRSLRYFINSTKLLVAFEIKKILLECVFAHVLQKFLIETIFRLISFINKIRSLRAISKYCGHRETSFFKLGKIAFFPL